MAFQTIHTKPNGAKYVYETVSCWDKEKKAPRNKQVCLGRLDEATGEIIPSKRRAPPAGKQLEGAPKVSTLIVGPGALLGKIASQTGLGAILAKAFPKDWKMILGLACFLAQKGLPLSRREAWSASRKHPYGGEIKPQRVPGLLQAMEPSAQSAFFKDRMRSLAEDGGFYYGITSVSPCPKQNEYVRYGHNRDNGKLPQINLGMVFGKQSGPPGFFRLPGNMPDQATVAQLEFIGQTMPAPIMDRGFYKITNVDALFEAKHNFVLMCPRRKWGGELCEAYGDGIAPAGNRHAMGGGEVLCMETFLHNWKGKRCYAHVYCNHMEAARGLGGFMLGLALRHGELASGNGQDKNKWACGKYFIVKETPKRGRTVKEDKKAAEDTKKKHAGFFCILARRKTSALEAIGLCRSKQAVEDCFDDLKNMLDMMRLGYIRPKLWTRAYPSNSSR